MARSSLRRIVLAAGASAGLAAAGSAAPAPPVPDLHCDLAPQLWADACVAGGRAAVGAHSAILESQDANADEALAAADRLAVEAVFACARAERWRDAVGLADLVAKVAGERAATLGQFTEGKGATPVCAHAADTRGEDLALLGLLENARRTAAREHFETLAIESVLTLPGAQSRRAQGVDESRCVWLSEAGRRRAHHGVARLREEDIPGGLMALSGALGAYDEAKAACRDDAREAVDARRRAISDLMVTAMASAEDASREAREVGLTLFEEGGGGLTELVRLEPLGEQRELLAHARPHRSEVASRQALGGADRGGRLFREGVAAPVDLVREARLREDAGHDPALERLLGADGLAQ